MWGVKNKNKYGKNTNFWNNSGTYFFLFFLVLYSRFIENYIIPISPEFKNKKNCWKKKHQHKYTIKGTNTNKRHPPICSPYPHIPWAVRGNIPYVLPPCVPLRCPNPHPPHVKPYVTHAGLKTRKVRYVPVMFFFYEWARAAGAREEDAKSMKMVSTFNANLWNKFLKICFIN